MTEPDRTDDGLDAARYRRLRVVGCAPAYTDHLKRGEVMRFTNLDEFVDANIKWAPSRGEARTAPQAPDTGGWTHTRSCAALGGFDSDCTCSLKWRTALATEQSMHQAWRKRAEEAEAKLATPPKPAPDALRGQR